MIVGQEVASNLRPKPAITPDPDQHSQSSPPETPASPKDVAEYSAEILTELRGLAANAGLTFLAYLIQVAVEEAKIQAEEHQER